MPSIPCPAHPPSPGHQEQREKGKLPGCSGSLQHTSHSEVIGSPGTNLTRLRLPPKGCFAGTSRAITGTTRGKKTHAKAATGARSYLQKSCRSTQPVRQDPGGGTSKPAFPWCHHSRHQPKRQCSTGCVFPSAPIELVPTKPRLTNAGSLWSQLTSFLPGADTRGDVAGQKSQQGAHEVSGSINFVS